MCLKKIIKICIATSILLLNLNAIADVSDPHLTKVSEYFARINYPTSPILLHFLLAMPKGADLHNHFGGAIYPQWLVSEVKADTTQPNWCVNPTDFTVTNDPNCINDKGILLRTVANASPNYSSVIYGWSMKNFTFTAPYFGHDHFFGIFTKSHPLVAQYGPKLLAKLMQQAADEHINYLELMVYPDQDGPSRSVDYAKYITTLPKDNDLTIQPQTVLSYPQVVAAISQLEQHDFTTNVVNNSVIANIRNLLSQARQQLGCNSNSPAKACSVVVKFQYESMRDFSLAKFFTTLYAGFEAAKSAPDLFVGVNIVGAEDNATALQDYNAQMLLIQYLQRHFDNSINTSLHAGELTDRLPNIVANPTDLSYHVYNAINIAHAERIGHAVDIFAELQAHPSLVQEMKQKHILVEVNLTSNAQVLGVCDGHSHCMAPTAEPKNYHYKHPFDYLLTQGVPVAISTDDQGIEQTQLYTEYDKAATRYHLSYQQLKNIDRNSLTYSFLPGKELWQAKADYTHFAPACGSDNPYSETQPSAACETYLAANLKAQVEWNLETQFAQFEAQISMV